MARKAFIFFLFALITAAWFPELIRMEKAFLSGDHREQQYPWAKFYQESIQENRLPWWTTDIHSGFPILAEGQIGAFYPLNYLFFRFLPAKIAYTGIILFQYWLGAVLLFLFLRKRGLSPPAAFFSCLAWMFGSTQGGYFYYNYISQKTVIWLPLTLLLVDRLEERKSWKDAVWLGAIFAVQMFAGYLQVAIYSAFYTALYFLWRGIVNRSRTFWLLFAGGSALGILFSLCQLLPTYELSLLSSRADAPHGLAYIGSMTPAGFITLFYPAWDSFVSSEMYLGLLPLFFAFAALLGKKDTHAKFFLCAAVFFVLLALGQYSPLYKGIVELTGFNSFRTPIKFLYFVTFSLCVLAGYGFDLFFNYREKFPKSALWLYAATAGVMAFFPAAASAILGGRRSSLLPQFQDFVVSKFHGKPGHPYPVEHYLQKAEALYDNFRAALDFSNMHTLIEFIFLLASAATVVLLVRVIKNRKTAMALCFVFLIADLYAYGFTSIRPNFERYDTIDKADPQDVVGNMVREDKSLFRVMEVYKSPEENRIYTIFPCWNMLDGIQDLGGYSPLVMKAYTDYLDGWGYINDSLSVHWVHPGKVISKLPELSALNVKYILSTAPVENNSLKLRVQYKGVNLYENTQVMPRAFFAPGIQKLDSFSDLSPASIMPVTVTDYRQNRLTLEVNAPSPGLVVVTDLDYKGWETTLDGKVQPPQRAAKLFRAVQIEQGKHKIEMAYRPRLFQFAAAAALLLFILLALAAVVIK